MYCDLLLLEHTLGSSSDLLAYVLTLFALRLVVLRLVMPDGRPPVVAGEQRGRAAEASTGIAYGLMSSTGTFKQHFT